MRRTRFHRGSRGLLFALLAALLAGCSAPAGPTAGPGQAPEPAATLRVMTYNIHHGADVDDRLDLGRIAEVIRRERPDVVALQEVDRGVERSGRRDLLRELAQLTGLEHTAFGKNIDHQGGDYGNGILSRFPIRQQVNTHLEQIAPGERRGVLQAVIDVRGREVVVMSTHFDVRNAEERLFGVRQIEEGILPKYQAYPLILAGDLNEQPTGGVYQRLSARLIDAWKAGQGPGFTIPVRAPNRRIDFIFHDARFAAVSARVPQTDASDHLPVVAELRFAN